MFNQLENEKSEFEKRFKEAESERQNLFDINRVMMIIFCLFSLFSSSFKEHEESLMDLIHEKEQLEHKVADLEATVREWAQKFVTTTDNQKLMQANHANMTNNLKQQYKCKISLSLISFIISSILSLCINILYQPNA